MPTKVNIVKAMVFPVVIYTTWALEHKEGYCCLVTQLCLTLCDPHGLQQASLPCPSLSPRVCSNLCPLSQWCHPTISSSVAPFSSCLQSFPASGFLMVVLKLWSWRRLLRVLWTERRPNQSIVKEINPEYSLEGLMLKLQYFDRLLGRADSLEKTLCLERLKAKGEEGSRGQDGLIASPTQWTWIWANSGEIVEDKAWHAVHAVAESDIASKQQPRMTQVSVTDLQRNLVSLPCLAKGVLVPFTSQVLIIPDCIPKGQMKRSLSLVPKNLGFWTLLVMSFCLGTWQ